MKKLTALFLALALCLSLCTVTAFADGADLAIDVTSTSFGSLTLELTVGETKTIEIKNNLAPLGTQFQLISSDEETVTVNEQQIYTTSKINKGATATISVKGLKAGSVTIGVKKGNGGTGTIQLGTISVTVNEAHTHTYAEEWSFDATNHWHAATCEHTDERADVAAHADNNKDHKCDVCGYVMSQCKDETGNDHKCDVCGKVLSECKDETGDGKCDTCGKDMGKPIKPVTPAKPVIPVCPIIKSIVKTVAVAKTIAVVKTVAVKTIKSILKWF